MSTRLTGFQSSRNDSPVWLPPHLLLLMKAPEPVQAAGVEVVLILIIEAAHSLEIAADLPPGAEPERVQDLLDIEIVNCDWRCWRRRRFY